MDDIVNTFLLAGNKCMPVMHLKQPGFTYSGCVPFTKNKERIGKFMQTGNKDFIYKRELDKACFQHDMAYGKSKNLAKGLNQTKLLRDKAFKVASDPKYDGYLKEDQFQWFSSFLIKNLGGGVAALFPYKSATKPNYQPANELHRQIIQKFKRQNVYSSFKDNIWDGDLADMQSLSKYNKGIKYLLCAIDLFSKYVWVIPLKNKRGITIAVFQKKKKKSKGHKSNKIWVD